MKTLHLLFLAFRNFSQNSIFDFIVRDAFFGHVDPEDLGLGLDVSDLDATLGREEDLVVTAKGVDANIIFFILKNSSRNKNLASKKTIPISPSSLIVVQKRKISLSLF